MDPVGFERSMGLTRRSQESPGLPESLEKCIESFSKIRRLEAATLSMHFIHLLQGFEETDRVMRLSTVLVGSLANQVTSYNLYRGSILGFAPQVCHLSPNVHIVFVAMMLILVFST